MLMKTESCFRQRRPPESLRGKEEKEHFNEVKSSLDVGRGAQSRI